MLKKSIFLALATLGLAALADTNTLELDWLQPPGYDSHLYSSTNLNGAWTDFGVVNPPYCAATTNQVAFFYVAVAPTNAVPQVNPPVVYNFDPNFEELTPIYTNQPAFAYQEAGYGGIYVWSITDQQWN